MRCCRLRAVRLPTVRAEGFPGRCLLDAQCRALRPGPGQDQRLCHAQELARAVEACPGGRVMPAGGFTAELMGFAIAWLYLLELAYWISVVQVLRSLRAAIVGRDWFGILGSLALALLIWPWAPMA